MTTSSAFGVALDAALKDARVEVKELARRSGLAIPTIYAYKGGTRQPSRNSVEAIADALVLGDAARSHLFAAAGMEISTDLAVLAADLVRGLPTPRDRELAVELLRTQARMTRPSRASNAQKAGTDEASMTPGQKKARKTAQAKIAKVKAAEGHSAGSPKRRTGEVP